MRPLAPRPGPPIPRTGWGLPADVAPGLERQMLDGLPPIAWFLGLLWAFFTVVHPFVIPSPLGLVLATATGAGAALTLTIAVAVRRRPPSPRGVHRLSLVLGFTALALTMLHLGLTGEPWQTTNLMLILVGGGAMLVSPVAYGILVAAGLAAWLGLASTVEWGDVTTHYGFAVPMAAGLGLFVHGLRRRSLVAAERMRLRDADHVRALEQTLEALADSERRAEATIAVMPDLLVRLDPDGVVENAHVPPTFSTPLERGDLLGRALDEFLPGEIAGLLREAAARARDEARPQSLEFELRPAGVRRWYEARLIASGDETIAVVRDTTERARREQAERTHIRETLRVATARLDAVVAAIPILVVAFDPAGRITLAEGRGLESVDFGLLPTDLLGATAADIGRDLPALAPAMADALAGTPTSATLRFGGRVWEAQLRPVADDDGRLTAVVAVVVDVTDRVEAEETLRRAKESAEEAARLKDAFLANMSHEIRTPMTAILGFAELLCMRLPEEDELGGYARLIRDGGKRLLELLNNILDLARLEADKLPLTPTPHPLAASASYVADLLGVLARQKGLRLDVTVDPELRTMVDPQREEQILTNVVGNAIRFTETGEVSLRADIDPEDPALVRIRVRDTGIGIDAAFLPRAFDEFRQESEGADRRHEGSGLGLAIAHRLTTRMGGTIRIESRKGEGTTVEIRLPRA